MVDEWGSLHVCVHGRGGRDGGDVVAAIVLCSLR